MTELAPDGDGWKMTIMLVSNAEELARRMWPFGVWPYGVGIRELAVHREPDVEGVFEIDGLRPDHVREMDEGFARLFVDAGCRLDDGPGGSGHGPQPGEFWLVDSSGQPLQQVNPRAPGRERPGVRLGHADGAG